MAEQNWEASGPVHVSKQLRTSSCLPSYDTRPTVIPLLIVLLAMAVEAMKPMPSALTFELVARCSVGKPGHFFAIA